MPVSLPVPPRLLSPCPYTHAHPHTHKQSERQVSSMQLPVLSVTVHLPKLLLPPPSSPHRTLPRHRPSWATEGWARPRSVHQKPPYVENKATHGQHERLGPTIESANRFTSVSPQQCVFYPGPWHVRTRLSNNSGCRLFQGRGKMTGQHQVQHTS